MDFKLLIKKITPPILLDFIKSFIFKRGWNYIGNYKTWKEALKHSCGYDSDIVIENIVKNCLQIKNCNSTYYVRDGVVLKNNETFWPLVFALLLGGLENNGELNVLDFGGGLGSVYFQYKHILKYFKKVQWNIVEQEKLVKYGKKFFEDNTLKFFYNLNEYEIYFNKTNLILLSGVIQYLESPYKLLNNLISKNVKYIIIDRIPLSSKKDKIMIQYNYSEKSSYPIWILNKNKLINFLEFKYELLYEFDSFEGTYKDCKFKFLLFKLKDC